MNTIIHACCMKGNSPHDHSEKQLLHKHITQYSTNSYVQLGGRSSPQIESSAFGHETNQETNGVIWC